MATRLKPSPAVPSGLTRPGELYVAGDELPLPDVIEKNSDSVWALWSDVVQQHVEATAEPEDHPDHGVDTQPATLMMDLPEPPADDKP